MAQDGVKLHGRGLWYGLLDEAGNQRVFTESEWSVCCQQAQAWGISVLHPKAADGGILWYDSTGYQMLKRVADHYGIICAPYHYCYGNTLGALDREAQICAALGGYFGAVCPDIEDKWEVPEARGANGWATRFGAIVRQHYSGPIYPTVFANPREHPLPWIEMNAWATAFMPQVYFDEWTPPTAQHAIDYVYTEWLALAAQCLASPSHKPLVPMLPIISLESRPASSEVVSWLTKMHGYGYCGFWYDAPYPNYAQSIKNAPLPAIVSLNPTPSPAPHAVIAPTPPVVKPVPVPTPIPVETVSRPIVSQASSLPSKPVGSTSPVSLVIPSTPQTANSSLPPPVSGVSLIDQGTMLMPIVSLATPPTSVPTVVPVPVPVPVIVDAVPPTSLATPVSLTEKTDEHDSTVLNGIVVQDVPLTQRQFSVLWCSYQADLTFDPNSPLIQKWCSLVEQQQVFPGAPLHAELVETVLGEPVHYITLESGKKLIHFLSTDRLILL